MLKEVIEKYVVARGSSEQSLAQEILTYTKQGYKLQGGVAIAYSPESGTRYYQALVKFKVDFNPIN